MNGIAYLCPQCRKRFDLRGFSVVNEVGRKHCSACGSNRDNLDCVDYDEFMVRKEQAEREEKEVGE